VAGGRWLLLAVIALAPLTLVLATADRMGLDPFAGVGLRWDEPLSAADVQPLYRHGTGQLTIDLTRTPLGGAPRTVSVENAVGDVVVLVPEDAAVTADGSTALGEVVTFDGHSELGLDRHASGSRMPANAKSTVHLHLRTGLGSVLVYVESPEPAPAPAPPSPAPPSPASAGGGA
ncbi:MAG TPA: LiaF domain-containing protein, partial [Candidatus Dormibacteraeota bacterium]